MAQTGLLGHLTYKSWDFYHFFFTHHRSFIHMVQVELALRLLTRMRSDGVRPGAPHYTSLGAVVERRVKYQIVPGSRRGSFEDRTWLPSGK